MSELEKTLGRVLGLGVMMSTAALIAGLLVIALGWHAPGMRLLAAGVLILIATPVARVVASSVAYALRRDWTFAILTLIVLAELFGSIAAAIRG